MKQESMSPSFLREAVAGEVGEVDFGATEDSVRIGAHEPPVANSTEITCGINAAKNAAMLSCAGLVSYSAATAFGNPMMAATSFACSLTAASMVVCSAKDLLKEVAEKARETKTWESSKEIVNNCELNLEALKKVTSAIKEDVAHAVSVIVAATKRTGAKYHDVFHNPEKYDLDRGQLWTNLSCAASVGFAVVAVLNLPDMVGNLSQVALAPPPSDDTIFRLADLGAQVSGAIVGTHTANISAPGVNAAVANAAIVLHATHKIEAGIALAKEATSSRMISDLPMAAAWKLGQWRQDKLAKKSSKDDANSISPDDLGQDFASRSVPRKNKL